MLKLLSEGTFARVYLAELTTGDALSRIVAVKLLREQWNTHPEIVQRTRDEARVLGRLHHRHIVKVEDLTSLGSQAAIVMEYLEGCDLKSIITYCKDQQIRIPRQACFEAMAAVARALDAAFNSVPLQGGESLRLVHRDIKPSNVMVTEDGDLKVLDFGTVRAKFEQREAETKALAFGSHGYMAPERLLGENEGHKSDVFSLGVCLYEMLTLDVFGRVHMRPRAFEEMLASRMDAMDLSDLDPTLSQQTRQTLELLLSYDPERRPSAARVVELMEALAEVAGDGELRRFCRDVVGHCRAQAQPSDGVGDPLIDATLVEDSLAPGDTDGPTQEEPPKPDDALTTIDVALDDPDTIDELGGSPYMPGELDGGDVEARLRVSRDEPVAAVSRSQVAPVRVSEAPSLDPTDWEVGPTEIAPSYPDPDDSEPVTNIGGPGYSPMVGSGFITADPHSDDPSRDLETGGASGLDPSDWEVAPTVIAPADDPLAPSAHDATRPMAVPPGMDTAIRGPMEEADPRASTGWQPPPTHGRWITHQDASYAAGVMEEPTGEYPILPADNVEIMRPPTAWSPADKAKQAVRRARGPGRDSLLEVDTEEELMPRPSQAGVGVKWTMAGVGLAIVLATASMLVVVVALQLRDDANDPGVSEPVMSRRPEVDGVPGGVVEVAPVTESTGVLSLELAPAGVASVSIYNSLGYRETWTGDEPLELRGLDPGLYKTKISPQGNPTIRTTVEVLAAKTCTYSFDVREGRTEWKRLGCE